MSENIADVLSEHARQRREHPAIEDSGRRILYAAFDLRVTDSAARLRAAGISAGEVVGVALPDGAPLLVTHFALARAGAVILAIDSNLTASERAKAIAKHPVKAVVARSKEPAPEGVAAIRLEEVCPTEGVDAALLRSFQRPRLGPAHPLYIVPSSGTTGAPKSFIWSHAQIIAVTRQYADCLGWDAEERFASLNGMNNFWGCEDCLATLRLGATVVVDRTSTPEELIVFAEDHRVTALTMTPAYLKTLLRAAEDRTCALPSLRSMCVGSAPMTPQERLIARERLTPNFIESYGTNEIGFGTVARPVDQDAHPESVGRVVAGLEAQVVDADDRPLPFGEVGQLRFRGPGVLTDGYEDPEATARAFRDGWYYPMDLAALNAEGYLFLKGRADDVINAHGAKFYPIEIENVLLAHPAVAEAAVFGWPHKRMGQVAIAYLVTREEVAEKALREHCGLSLASYKLPRRIVFVEDMPRNAMGKILKRRLKEMFRDSLDRERASP